MLPEDWAAGSDGLPHPCDGPPETPTLGGGWLLVGRELLAGACGSRGMPPWELPPRAPAADSVFLVGASGRGLTAEAEIGRASCRERVFLVV